MNNQIKALMRFLDARGISPESLKAFLPKFGTHTESLACTRERGAMMRRLAEERDAAAETGRNGISFRCAAGIVHVQPNAARQALKITAEGIS